MTRKTIIQVLLVLAVGAVAAYGVIAYQKNAASDGDAHGEAGGDSDTE